VIQSCAGVRNSAGTTLVNTIELPSLSTNFTTATVRVREIECSVEQAPPRLFPREPGLSLDTLPITLFSWDPSIEGVAVMTLRVVPEGLAAACAGVEALTARLAAVHAVAAPLITAVAPPAVDPVSLQSAAEFSVRGGLHAAVAAQGAEELGRAGIGVGESGASYASGDAAAASSYVVIRD
jgi:hypothetical protein